MSGLPDEPLYLQGSRRRDSGCPLSDNEVTPPTVADLYRRGLYLGAKAFETLESGRGTETAIAYAAAAQACFAGVQAAAFAPMAADCITGGGERMVDSGAPNGQALAMWEQIIDMSGGQ